MLPNDSAVRVQLFKCYQGAVCELTEVKFKDNIDRSVRLHRCKQRGRFYFVSLIILHGASGGFIHQNTGDHVGFAGNQVLIRHRIDQRINAISQEFVAAEHIVGSCTDLRKSDCLSFIVQIGVLCDCITVLRQLFDYDQGLPFHAARIDCEEHLDRSVDRTRSEVFIGNDVVAKGVKCRLTGCNVIQNTSQSVVFADLQALIRDRINQLQHTLCQEFFVSILIRGRCADLRDVNSLLCVLNVFVNSNDIFFVADLFKRNQCLTAHLGRVKDKLNLSHTVTGACSELSCRDDLVACGIYGRISGFFIHQLSSDCVFVAFHQIFKTDIVCQSNLVAGIDCLSSVFSEQLCTDLRDGNCLVLILDILVFCDQPLIDILELFKCYQCLVFEPGGVKFKGHVNRPVCFECNKGCFSGHFIAVQITNCLTCSLIL